MAFNALLIIPLEGFKPLVALLSMTPFSPSAVTDGRPAVGPLTLVANAAMGFFLTLSSTYLIGISAIVLSLAKVCKDVMIVFASAVWVGDTLTRTQVVGYAFATAGLVAYKTLKL